MFSLVFNPYNDILLIFSIVLVLGIWGLVKSIRLSVIFIIVYLELIFISINCIILVISLKYFDTIGQIFTMFSLTVLATETSIGLGILILGYKTKGTSDSGKFNLLKG